MLPVVRVLCCVSVLFVLVGPAEAQEPTTDTLRVSLTEVVTSALRASPELDQRRAERQFAEARRHQARASRFLTDLSLNTAHSLAPGLEDVPAEASENALHLDTDIENDWSPGALRPFNRFEVSLRQPLFTWGELAGNVEAARHGVAVEEARMEKKALEVAMRAGETYYNLLLTEAFDRLADRMRDVIDQAKRKINRLLEEGNEEVAQADLFQTRLTEEEFRRRIVEIEQNQATALSALRRQLFVPEETVIIPSVDELTPMAFSIHPDSLDHYIELGLANRPEVQQARVGKKARRALVEVERSNYYPKIGLQASISQSVTVPDRPNPDNPFVGDAFMGTDTRTGIGIQQNLNFGQVEARVEQAEAELKEVKHQEAAAEQLVRFEVEEAYRNLLIAKTAVESRDRATTISGEWLRTEQIDFDLGFGDTENLVKAVRADLEQKASRFEAVKRYNVAVLQLLRATGILTDRARRGTLVDSSDSGR